MSERSDGKDKIMEENNNVEESVVEDVVESSGSSGEQSSEPEQAESSSDSSSTESNKEVSTDSESVSGESINSDTTSEESVYNSSDVILDKIADMVADKIKEGEAENLEESEVIEQTENVEELEGGESSLESGQAVTYGLDSENVTSYDSDILAVLNGISESLQTLYEYETDERLFQNSWLSKFEQEDCLDDMSWAYLSTTDFLLILVIIILLFRWLYDFGKELFI